MKKWIRRISIGCGSLVALALVIIVGVSALWWSEARTWTRNIAAVFEEPEYANGFEDRGDFLAYLKSHPKGFSLVSYGTDAEGEISNSTPRIEHLSEKETPLASTKKIVILAAYAREVSRGELDPEERVRISDWERYYLPNTDMEAHPAALEDLGAKTKENGSASNPEREVPLSDVTEAMISHSDNAAADYLIQRVGSDEIRAVIEDEDLGAQDEILPLLGTYLLWFDLDSESPDLSAQISGERLKELKSMSNEEYAAKTRELNEAYASGETSRKWREDGPPGIDVRYQGAVTREFETRGTAREYARIMAEVSTGEFVGPEVSGIMRSYLDWPMEQAGNRKEYRTLGAKGGSLPGVLNQASYNVPKSGDFAGRRRVVVLFMRDMPMSAYIGAQRSNGLGDFLSTLSTDRKFAERVERELGDVK